MLLDGTPPMPAELREGTCRGGGAEGGHHHHITTILTTTHCNNKIKNYFSMACIKSFKMWNHTYLMHWTNGFGKTDRHAAVKA